MTQQDQQTVGVEDFFDNIGGTGAVTAKLQDIDDYVIGTIESQRVVDYVPFGKKDPERLDDGKIRKQLVVILKTDLRNWQGVKEAPLVDRDDPGKGRKAPDQDDGRRAVYVPQYKNIHYAVKDAVAAANGGKQGPLVNGAKFGVKVIDLEDTGQGNPKKVHKAVYEPPAASQEFFGSAQEQVTPAAQEPQHQAPPVATPPTPTPETGPPAVTEQPAPQVDPWTGSAPADKPPF